MLFFESLYLASEMVHLGLPGMQIPHTKPAPPVVLSSPPPHEASHHIIACGSVLGVAALNRATMFFAF